MPAAQPCPACQREVERTYRYCPWCAAPQRLKLVEFFAPHPAHESDQELALRVSRYLGADPDDRQTRISIWHQDGSALAAIGLDDDETERLACFLNVLPPAPPPVESLRDRLGRHWRAATDRVRS